MKVFLAHTKHEPNQRSRNFARLLSDFVVHITAPKTTASEYVRTELQHASKRAIGLDPKPSMHVVSLANNARSKRPACIAHRKSSKLSGQRDQSLGTSTPTLDAGCPNTFGPYADSFRNGITCFSNSLLDIPSARSYGMASATSNLPEAVRRRLARWAPQPSFCPSSCASVRT